MASSENLASTDPSLMMYHPSSFTNSSFILPDTFNSSNNNYHHHQPILDNVDTLSSVSFSDVVANVVSPLFNLSSQLDNHNTTPFTPSSHVSGSEPDSPAPHVTNGSSAVAVPPPRRGGKVMKRKSRASKRCQTTFITADPANFRQMVQQVTGVRLNGRNSYSYVPIGALPKSEPKRASSNYGHHLQGDGCLPTLDTSTYLLEYQLQNMNCSGMNNGTEMGGTEHVGVRGPTVMTGGNGAAGGSTGFDFEGFSSFPTLESWKVM